MSRRPTFSSTTLPAISLPRPNDSGLVSSLKPVRFPAVSIRSAGLAVAVAVLVGGPLVFSDAFPGWSTALAGVLSLVLIAILALKFRRIPAVMMLACLAVCALPGFFYAADRPGSWTGLCLLAASILVFLLVLWSLEVRSSLKQWTRFVVAAGAALAALGPLLFEYESKGRLLGTWEGLGWVGETVDPNVLAGVTAMIIPLALARIIHKLPAAEPPSLALAALPPLGLLGIVHDYACGALACKALPARTLRLFASAPYELCGLASILVAEGKMRGWAVAGGILLLGGLILGESIGAWVGALVSCVIWLGCTGRQKRASGRERRAHVDDCMPPLQGAVTAVRHGLTSRRAAQLYPA